MNLLPPTGLVSVSKNLSERRSTKLDVTPVTLRSAPPSAKTQKRVSQVLQVQVPLNPLRKKSTAKDIGPLCESSSSLSLFPAVPVVYYVWWVASRDPKVGDGSGLIGWHLCQQFPKRDFEIYMYTVMMCFDMYV